MGALGLVGVREADDLPVDHAAAVVVGGPAHCDGEVIQLAHVLHIVVAGQQLLRAHGEDLEPHLASGQLGEFHHQGAVYFLEQFPNGLRGEFHRGSTSPRCWMRQLFHIQQLSQ